MIYMCLERDDARLGWLEKHIRDLGFPSLYDASPYE